MDNGLELVNASLIDALLFEYGISRQLTTPDRGQKRNGKVERRIGLIREGARAALEEAALLFPGTEFPSKALDFNAMWAEAFSWMSGCINILGRIDTSRLCCALRDDVREAPSSCPLLFLMPGIHHTRLSAKIQAKGARCFYLNSNVIHSRDSYKVL